MRAVAALSDLGAGRQPRAAVVDLGSNSVRLVVFEGAARNPITVFNEKAVLRLGRGLQASGRLDEAAVTQALTVLQRYHAIAGAMGVVTFEVLATAAVRDAVNGPAFVATLRARMPKVPIHVLSGAAEAALSAEGVLCGIPRADGILADIGGGSLELVRLAAGAAGTAVTLKLGVIRLAERAGGDPLRARGIVEEDLTKVPWLGEATGSDLYLVGGAWRALARIQMARTAYPLSLVHHYTIGREEARDLADTVAAAGRRALERLPGVPRRRIDDLPYAAVLLRRLLRATGAGRVVFSASGLREGWYARRGAAEAGTLDPLLAAAEAFGGRLARDPRLAAALFGWTAQLFAYETEDAARLRLAACWLSDAGSQDHPERRAEQAFQRILWQPGIGLDHHERAFLALAIAARYEAETEAAFLHPARMLLDAAAARQAEMLGRAFRLAYTLSAGTAALLAGTALLVPPHGTPGRLLLRLHSGGGVFEGEGISRRLDRLAQLLGLESATEVVTGPAG